MGCTAPAAAPKLRRKIRKRPPVRTAGTRTSRCTCAKSVRCCRAEFSTAGSASATSLRSTSRLSCVLTSTPACVCYESFRTAGHRGACPVSKQKLRSQCGACCARPAVQHRCIDNSHSGRRQPPSYPTGIRVGHLIPVRTVERGAEADDEIASCDQRSDLINAISRPESVQSQPTNVYKS